MTAEQELKEEVYALFKQHPELLYPVEEGLTKGGQLLYCRRRQPPNAACAEQLLLHLQSSTALHTCS